MRYAEIKYSFGLPTLVSCIFLSLSLSPSLSLSLSPVTRPCFVPSSFSFLFSLPFTRKIMPWLGASSAEGSRCSTPLVSFQYRWRKRWRIRASECARTLLLSNLFFPLSFLLAFLLILVTCFSPLPPVSKRAYRSEERTCWTIQWPFDETTTSTSFMRDLPACRRWMVTFALHIVWLSHHLALPACSCSRTERIRSQWNTLLLGCIYRVVAQHTYVRFLPAVDEVFSRHGNAAALPFAPTHPTEWLDAASREREG